jgi:superfamily II DNA or RNA helicase
MIAIKDVISSLPLGRLNSYLAKVYKDGFLNYFNDNQKAIDIHWLIINEFKYLILKDEILKDLKLFPNEFLLEILSLEVTELGNCKLSLIRKKIISYYDFIYADESESHYLLENVNLCDEPLHDFQERLRKKVINLLFNGKSRFLIHMPTGAGKTRTASEIIIDFVRLSSSKALFAENLKILWIAQSSELCNQASETFKFIYEKKGTSSIKVGHFYGNNELSEDLLDGPAIIFCGIQKLLLHYKEDIWKKIKSDNYLVIVDEAHRSVASKWKKALDYFVADNRTYLLGLTATPGTGSIEDISAGYTIASYYDNNKITLMNEQFQEIENPISYLVERNFLAEIKRTDIISEYIEITDGLSLDSSGFNFSSNTLNELSINSLRNNSIINIIKKHIEKKHKILVFTCGVEHNRILKSILTLNNIRSEYIDADTKNRNFLINEFKENNLDVLLNFGVLTTGFDAPKTDVCIIARPISSIVMYSQMVGRILRGPLNKGNRTNYLYTIKDNFNHGDYDEMFNSFNDFYN